MLPARLYEGIHRDRVPTIARSRGSARAKLDAAAERVLGRVARARLGPPLVGPERALRVPARTTARSSSRCCCTITGSGRCASRARPDARSPARSARPGSSGSRATSRRGRSSTRCSRSGATAASGSRTSCSWGWGSRSSTRRAVYQAATILHQSHGCQISAKRIVISTSGVVPGDPPVHRRRAAVPARVQPRERGSREARGADADPAALRVRGVPRRRPPLRAPPRRASTSRSSTSRSGTSRWATTTSRRSARTSTGFKYILNVIPLNPIGNDLESPTMAEVRAWTQKLRPIGIPVKVRYSGGKDQLAGCGPARGGSLTRTSRVPAQHLGC